MEKIIRVENIDFSYNKPSSFIKEMSFTIDKGSYTCIIGDNGSGKTTLSKLLSGLLISDRGDVFIDGIRVCRDNMRDIRKYIGVIFQNPDNQYFASSLKEDLIFGLENYNYDPEVMDGIIDEVSNLCGVKHLLDKDHTSLSGGEKQKGNLACELAINPEILILDEACSMLDSSSKKEMRKIIKEKQNEGKTIVSVTHDLDEILIADQIIVLDNGKIIFKGTKEELFELNDNSNIHLPMIMQLQKEMGYQTFVSEEEFFDKAGDTI